ncbi:SdiA-regulated domain-containing protein [Endozoicomonas numazuensis]|uniref:SdiA-regulated domain-containing protein n=1 Tax=Endozoicomonas numazuensis TaxID=1137799 RepID=UPI000689F1AA|nr:SdiA-regulated domain-containing protein [Endozoicomonas numazuensis]
MKKSIKWSLKVIAVLVLAMMAINYFDIDDKLYDEYLSLTLSAEQQADAIRLNEYELEAGPLKLAEAGDQVSGVTWSPVTHSLYVVARGDNAINVLEYDQQGSLKRKLTSNLNADVEGIAWVGGNRFIIVNERQQELLLVDIKPNAKTIDFSDAPTFTFGVGAAGNKGFEGIAWDPDTNSVYVLKERDPIQIYRIDGFTEQGTNRKLAITEQEAMRESLRLFNRDLSGMHYDSVSGHFLVLSDESHSLTELDESGSAVSVMELEKGWQGLKNTIEQPEGVAMDRQGTVYIVGEPNDLYIFKK